MAKYRKMPVVIEAIQWDGRSLSKAIEFCGRGNLDITGKYPGELKIKTLEGTMNASIGDYIIRGVQGEIYPCKPDIFEQTYESVDEHTITIDEKFIGGVLAKLHEKERIMSR